jgi:predicted ATPase
MSYLSSFSIITGKEHPFPYDIPAVRFAKNIELDSRVNFFIGDNGAGKSTLLETIAYRLQFNGLSGSPLYEITENSMSRTAVEYTEHFSVTKNFLNNPEAYLRHLM